MNATAIFSDAPPRSHSGLTDHGVNRRLALVVLALGLLAASRTPHQSSQAADQVLVPTASLAAKAANSSSEARSELDHRGDMKRRDYVEVMAVRSQTH